MSQIFLYAQHSKKSVILLRQMAAQKPQKTAVQKWETYTGTEE